MDIKPKIMAQYLGPGYFAGIPARDLSVDDWANLTLEQQQMVQKSKLYRLVPVEYEKPAKSGAEKPAKKK